MFAPPHSTLDSSNCVWRKGETASAFVALNVQGNTRTNGSFVCWFPCIRRWHGYAPIFKISAYVFCRPAVDNWKLSDHVQDVTIDSVPAEFSTQFSSADCTVLQTHSSTVSFHLLLSDPNVLSF